MIPFQPPQDCCHPGRECAPQPFPSDVQRQLGKQWIPRRFIAKNGRVVVQSYNRALPSLSTTRSRNRIAYLPFIVRISAGTFAASSAGCRFKDHRLAEFGFYMTHDISFCGASSHVLQPELSSCFHRNISIRCGRQTTPIKTLLTFSFYMSRVKNIFFLSEVNQCFDLNQCSHKVILKHYFCCLTWNIHWSNRPITENNAEEKSILNLKYSLINNFLLSKLRHCKNSLIFMVVKYLFAFLYCVLGRYFFSGSIFRVLIYCNWKCATRQWCHDAAPRRSNSLSTRPNWPDNLCISQPLHPLNVSLPERRATQNVRRPHCA